MYPHLLTQAIPQLDNDPKFHLDIDAESDPMMELSIERHGTELIVCQYYHQRGGLMRVPEMRFQIENSEWTPIFYRIDPLNAYEYSTEGLDIDDTVKMWARNLQSQGFLDGQVSPAKQE